MYVMVHFICIIKVTYEEREASKIEVPGDVRNSTGP